MLPASTDILEAMTDAFVQLDGAGHVQYVNARAERLLRLDREELSDANLFELVPDWQESELSKGVAEALAQRLEREVELYHPLSQRWFGMRLHPSGEKLNLYFTDITDQMRARQAREQVHSTLQDQVRAQTSKLERLNEQLLHDSLHDALTGLPNRTYLMDSLRRSMQDQRKANSLLFLDFDGFKLINDSLGHTVGDELLIALSRRLRSGLRPSELIARLGGDEFTIILTNTQTVSSALAVVKRLQDQLSQPFRIGEYKLYLSASIGVVHDLSNYDTPEDVLRDADLAMYHAKGAGKGGFAVFDTALRDKVILRMELESDLRLALRRNELQVHYQPIISLPSGTLSGFETLVRWHHPERGLIVPDEFISVAEDTGLIADIDVWVVRQACRELVAWMECHAGEQRLELSVNFSGRHFARPDLHERLRNIFRETGFAANHLNIEITETVLMDDTAHTQKMLARLRNLGIALHIDDFGTGYSSLSYLQRFAAGGLKIDRTFIQQLSEPKSAELVRALIAMAHSLDMRVVAEGVETEKQLSTLREFGCDYAQGYYVARPSPELSQFASLLEPQKQGAAA